MQMGAQYLNQSVFVPSDKTQGDYMSQCQWPGTWVSWKREVDWAPMHGGNDLLGSRVHLEAIPPLPEPRVLGPWPNEMHSILPLLQSLVSHVIPQTVGGICPQPGSKQNVFQSGAESALWVWGSYAKDL